MKGVDYSETYSPVVRYATVRHLLALAAQLDLLVYQMDAVTAFLQGDLDDEEIYIWNSLRDFETKLLQGRSAD